MCIRDRALTDTHRHLGQRCSETIDTTRHPCRSAPIGSPPLGAAERRSALDAAQRRSVSIGAARGRAQRGQ
eukprot:10278076-Alexandrium_andersonii.AAC.1